MKSSITMEKQVVLGIFTPVIPLLIMGIHLYNGSQTIMVDPVKHVWLVLLTCVMSLGLALIAYKEYRKTGYRKLYLLSVGFLGIAILYGTHALHTPGYGALLFHDRLLALNAFAFFGDCSRLWFAATFFLQTFVTDQKEEKWLPAIWLFWIAAFLLVVIVWLFWNPHLIPKVKDASGVDTHFLVLLKGTIIAMILFTVVRYLESWLIVRNMPLLTLIIGGALIAETPIFLTVSTPWNSNWWLAHYVFALSFLVIAFGLYLARHGEEFQFFNVTGQLQTYIDTVRRKDEEITKSNEELRKVNALIIKELQVANELQQRLLPIPYEGQRFCINSVYKPVQFVSGDFFDYSVSGNKLRIVLFDVMGHGFSTALLTMTMKVLYRKINSDKKAMQLVLAELNQECLNLIDDTYIAAIMLEFDKEAGVFTVAAAGISDVLRVSPNKTEKISLDGFLLGVCPNAIYEERTFSLLSGEYFILATDGISEWIAEEHIERVPFEQCAIELGRLIELRRVKDDATAICIQVNGG